MKTLANASAKLFDRLFSSLFALYDGDQDICGTDAMLSDEEQDDSHPLAHSYFGA